MARWLTLILILANGVAAYWLGQRQSQRLDPRDHLQRPSSAAVASVRLLSEVPAESVPSKTGADNRVRQVKEPAASTLSSQCRIFGPFDAQARPAELQASMERAGLTARVVASSPADKAVYWVYLPPFDSRSAAEAQLRKLRGRNIDSFVFEQGPRANGISLGVFDSRANAMRHKAVLEDRGLRPELAVEPQTPPRYWLLTTPIPAERLPETLQTALAGAGKPPQTRENDCSTEYFPIPK